MPNSSSSCPRVATRVVATIGPASRDPAVLESLFDAGVDVARLNFSHGSRRDHDASLAAIRRVAANRGAAVAVMGDLCGPKLRLGALPAGQVEVKVGDRVRISRSTAVGPGRIAINQPEVLDDVEVGHHVLIDDGAVRLAVAEKTADELVCRGLVGGIVRDHKGVNLPDSNLRLGSMTDKDRADARWAAEAGLDYLALSFVRNAADVEELRSLLAEIHADMHVVAKIETPQAVANLAGIVAASDAVLVARGDLGVEMDIARVPRIQKEIVDLCRRAGKPAIVATQMLQSMVDSPMPTRAEVTDVANAIVDGADAIMLSAETAVGRYPVEAVNMMQRIARETEVYDQHRAARVPVNADVAGVTAALTRSLARLAEDVGAGAVAVWTEHGTLARLLSKRRLDRPVIALTPTEPVRRRMALYYGVTALRADKPADATERVLVAAEVLRRHGVVQPGDRIVVGLGPHSLGLGDTGSVVVHIVGAG